MSELYKACQSRWETGSNDRCIRETDYEAIGQVDRALTTHATTVHDNLVKIDPLFAATIRNVFIRMVAFAGAERMRHRVFRYELAYDDAHENRRVADVLEAFT